MSCGIVCGGLPPSVPDPRLPTLPRAGACLELCIWACVGNTLDMFNGSVYVVIHTLFSHLSWCERMCELVWCGTQSRESHHHTRDRDVSGHHVGCLGPCGNTIHIRIHSIVQIFLSRVSADLNLREGRSAPRCARRAAHVRRGSKSKTESDVMTAQGRRLAKVSCTLTALVGGEPPRRWLIRSCNMNKGDKTTPDCDIIYTSIEEDMKHIFCSCCWEHAVSGCSGPDLRRAGRGSNS